MVSLGVENISSRALGWGGGLSGEGLSAHMGFLCKAVVVTGLPPKDRANV